MGKDKDKNKPGGKGGATVERKAAAPGERSQPSPDDNSPGDAPAPDATDVDAMVESVAVRVAEMISPRLDEINEDVLRLGRDTEKLDLDQDQMRKSFADNIQKIIDDVRSLTPDGLIDGVVETLKPRLQELVDDVMERIGDDREETQAALETLDKDQRKLSATLAQLSETYEDVKAITSTDWREFAGEEFEQAEEDAVELGRVRKKAMANLTKYERDTSKVKRDVDPHYAKLKVDANNAVDKAVAAKRKVTKMKDAAMQAVAV